jgi:hypothetical protein
MSYSLSDILRSQTCFSHAQPTLDELPLNYWDWSLDELLLLSNRSKDEVLDCLQCNEESLDEYCDQPSDWTIDY